VDRQRNLDRRYGTAEPAELGIAETEDKKKGWKDITECQRYSIDGW